MTFEYFMELIQPTVTKPLKRLKWPDFKEIVTSYK